MNYQLRYIYHNVLLMNSLINKIMNKPYGLPEEHSMYM